MRAWWLSLLGLSLLTLVASLLGPQGWDVTLLTLRLSRVVLALLVGASLGAVGCALQAILRNPLADPYILGVSGGSAVFGALAIAFWAQAAFFWPPLMAITGAALATLAILLAMRRQHEGDTDMALLLGVAINAFSASFISVLKTWLPAQRTQSLIFWLMGSVGYLEYNWLLLALVLISLGLFLLWHKRAALELLVLGDDEATRLGLDVVKEKRWLFFACSLLVGMCVACCGMIGFVGLVVPHLLRPFMGNYQPRLLPFCMLLGAAVLLVSDTLSRLSFLAFSSEVPVGAITALLGAPIFVAILFRTKEAA